MDKPTQENLLKLAALISERASELERAVFDCAQWMRIAEGSCGASLLFAEMGMFDTAKKATMISLSLSKALAGFTAIDPSHERDFEAIHSLLSVSIEDTGKPSPRARAIANRLDN